MSRPDIWNASVHAGFAGSEPGRGSARCTKLKFIEEQFHVILICALCYP